MDKKKIEILSNMKLIPLTESMEEMYETIVNYAREIFGARRVVFYGRNESWHMEYSYPSREMLGFELEEEYLSEIYEKFVPYVLSPEEAKKLGINIEGITVFLPLGTKDCYINLLLLVGVKFALDDLEEELPILKIFSRYAEIFIYGVKKLNEKKEILSHEDELLSELKKNLISMISRNLRTPLASILAYAETLKESEGLSEKERTEFINTVYEKSLELKEAIDNMMDYISILVED